MSISDVARKAGVSVATASRVINSSDYAVREETRQRVLLAVAELDYSPSILARALVTRQSKIIGIIVHDILDPYFAEIVRGVQDAAHEHGYLTMVCNSDRQTATEASYLLTLRDYRVDGVVLAGGGFSGDGVEEHKQAVQQLLAKGARIVALAPQRFEVTYVTVDNRSACHEMTNYLLGLGHRRIGFISGPARLLTSELREQGFREAMASAGQVVDPGLVVPGNFDFESGRKGAALMELPGPPTAIFAANDEMAVGCLTALRRRGLRVPDDVTVVGFDDLKLLQSVDPFLTTVHVPLHDLGAMAMRQLLRAFRDEPVESPCVLPYRLMIRESSARPPSRG